MRCNRHSVVMRLLARDNLMGVTRLRALSSYFCQAPRSATHRATLAGVSRRTLCRASATPDKPCDAVVVVRTVLHSCSPVRPSACFS